MQLSAQQWKKHEARGDAYFSYGRYAKALEYYDLAFGNNKNPNISKKLAATAIKLNQYSTAEKHFKRLYQQRLLNDTLLINYAEVLLMQGKVFETRVVLEEVSIDSPRKELLLISSDSLRKWENLEFTYSIKNLSYLNTSWSEVSPRLINEGMVFSSTREGTIIKKKNYGSGDPFYDIFLAPKHNNKFKKAKPYASIINSNHHEGALCFNTSEDTIYFTRSFFKPWVDSVKTDNFDRPKLYSSVKEKGHWTKPQQFYYNDSLYAFGYPNISPDGKMFFFVSDMKGGYGGTDIYVCFKIDSLWTDPINLGPTINTPFDEISPFYHASGKLYFSSKGHPGYGGFDVYIAHQKNGDWYKIENMKAPINSPKDDFDLILEGVNDKGYFTSNRAGGKGKEDIYEFRKE